MQNLSIGPQSWLPSFTFGPAKKTSEPAFLELLGENLKVMGKRVVAAVAKVFYNISVTLDRIRRSSDGLDKTLKLLSGASVAAMLLPDANVAFCGELNAKFRSIDRMFSGVSVFGRYNELMRLDKHGHRAITHKSSLKQANVILLTVAKTLEFLNLLRSMGFYSVKALCELDSTILGGVCQNMGQVSVINSAVSLGLVGWKNYFLVGSSTYAIANSAVLLMDGNPTEFETKRAVVGMLQDAGKIYLCTAVFAVTWTWAAIAMLTAVCGLTKILLDSYEASRIQGENTGYPKWIQALKV